ncbi:MAG: efflux RND transporter periplasmic adaptor subunit [Myxococcota bacterium]
MTEHEQSGVNAPKGLRLRRVLSFLVPIIVASAFLVAVRAGRPRPKKRPVDSQGTPVRIIEVRPRTVVPKAIGYGVVQAAYEWELVAEVSGRVVEMNANLRVGEVLPKGTKLLQINPENYRLTEQQRQASLQNVAAQIRQLELQRQSAEANLKIEQQSLTLAERDLRRTRSLFASGSATQADVDTAQRNVLAQRSAVQSLQNQLREIPANMAALRAQERESKASLEGARLDVGRTEIFAPFDIRIRELSIQPSELVTSGQTLGVADGIDTAEVPAQLTLGALQPLFAGTSTPTGPAPSIETPAALGRRLRELDIGAVIRIESGGLVAEWRGEVTRIATVSATTRTIGVVVTVGEPMSPGDSTLPLLSGMYAEVELSGEKQSGCLAVPRSAIHSGNQVYVVDTASRLVRREVTIGLRQAAFACIRSGLAHDEKVVLTDLQPAVQGMLLSPVIDQTSTEQLLRDLSGEGVAK